MEELKLKENTKSKSIIIDGSIHNKLKLHCKSRGLKIGAVIEDLINLYLSDVKTVQKLIDEKR